MYKLFGMIKRAHSARSTLFTVKSKLEKIDNLKTSKMCSNKNFVLALDLLSIIDTTYVLKRVRGAVEVVYEHESLDSRCQSFTAW